MAVVAAKLQATIIGSISFLFLSGKRLCNLLPTLAQRPLLSVSSMALSKYSTNT